MEAREIKLDIEHKDPAVLSQEEQRLKAIKQILVGNQIDRLENRFRGLSRRVESTNGHLVSTVEELNQQIALIKAEMQLRDPNSEDTTKLKQGLLELLEVQKGLNLEDPKACKQLEVRMNTIENTVSSTNGMAKESQEKIQSMAGDIQDFKNKLKATQERLSALDNGGSAEQKAKVNERLNRLEAKMQALNPKKIEAKLSQRQNEFEDGVQDLVERLAGRVNERFEFAGNSRKELFEKQKELDHRVNSIQDILENDIMSFLQNGGTGDPRVLEAHVKGLASDLERKITESNIRMEAKMEAIMDMSSRQMRQAAPQEDPKMKAIKDTLKTLSQLLDE